MQILRRLRPFLTFQAWVLGDVSHSCGRKRPTPMLMTASKSRVAKFDQVPKQQCRFSGFGPKGALIHPDPFDAISRKEWCKLIQQCNAWTTLHRPRRLKDEGLAIGLA
eukprot:5011791-Amphidinium_carterae.2